MTEPEDKPTSAQFEHCLNVYQTMKGQATEEVIDDTTCLVYEGHLTKLFGALRLSTPYYTSVMKRLKQLGCVEQIRRGGGSANSRWILLQEPNEESFNSFEDSASRPRGKVAALEQENRLLATRVKNLESAHERMAIAVEDLQEKMDKLHV